MTELLFVASMIGSIYFIVFCRLMIDGHQSPRSGRRGLALLMSLPARKGLDPQGLRYWRLYWTGWLAMITILCVGLWWRHPHMAAGLGGG